jgi:hypothetical protein
LLPRNCPGARSGRGPDCLARILPAFVGVPEAHRRPEETRL